MLNSLDVYAEDFCSYSQKQNPQYEYRIISVDKFTSVVDLERGLNRLGREGWELVGSVNHQRSGVAVHYRYHFKRMRQRLEVALED